MSRVAVVGLGLIGGSAALALRARGYDRSTDVRARAQEKGVETAETLAGAVADADVVLAAVPTADTPAVLGEIARLAPRAILTDAASLKKSVVEAAAALPEGTRFVGGHPMAGSHEGGIEAATPLLFRGRTWILVPNPRSDEASIEAVSAAVRRMGARPALLGADRHDRLMTWASHLPYAVATALARAADSGAGPELAEITGPALLDTTRVAGQNLSLALELALADPDALASAIDAVRDELAALASALRRRDEQGVRSRFEKAAQVRRGLETAALHSRK